MIYHIIRQFIFSGLLLAFSFTAAQPQYFISLAEEEQNISDPDKILSIAENQKRVLDTTKSLAQREKAHTRLGDIYMRFDNHQKAASHFQKALKLAKRSGTSAAEKVQLLKKITRLHYLTGNISKATTYLDSTVVALERISESPRKAAVYSEMGTFFSKIKRFDKALFFYEKANELLKGGDNPQQIAFLQRAFGRLHHKIYNYQKGLDSLTASLHTFQKLKDTVEIGRTHFCIGLVQLDKRDYPKAEHNFRMALSQLQNLPHYHKLKLRSTDFLALSLMEQEKYSEALVHLRKYLPEAENSGDYEIVASYHHQMHKIFQKTGRLDAAMEHQKKYYAFKDSLNIKNQEDSLHNAIVHQRLNALDQKHQLASSKKMADQQRSALSQLQWGVFILILLIILLAVWFFIKLRNTKKYFNDRLAEKNEAIEEADKKLSETNRDIEAKISERTKELQQQIEKYKKKDVDLKKALKEAEDANYLKNAFLSNMSHEIRTPLNGIIGFSSLLETELSLMENTELYGYAQGIQTSGERLLHLLNNIIDISRIEANDLQVSLQETNMEQIVEKSAELFRFKANEKGLKFNLKLEETPMVYADPTSLSKVISDIIDNSVKYTEKGFINITSGVDEENKEVFVKIRDTGVGIDENYLPKIFEAFRQESLGYSRAYQGAGLGLPLAKRLLDLMDGRIDIESGKNKGTTVTIFMPTREKSTTAQEKPQDKKHIPELFKPIQDINILLVEDDRMNRLVINKMLDNEWSVISAEDGDVTLEEVDKAYKKNTIFDVMLFDINLPSPWDGIKLMKHIRKKYPEYKDVPFIAQTAYAMRTDRTRMLEEGFDEYISKPINQQRLLTMIYNFLRKK